MSRKVLVVCPHFAPINSPDMHRVRTSLPYFRENGWEPHVLALDPRYSQAALDEHLALTLPTGISVSRVCGSSSRVTGFLGIHDPVLRSLRQFAATGSRIIAAERISLVYFSTTAFPIFALGPYWRARYRVPYILDFQDPWYNDYYSRHTAIRPPGGRLKFGVANTIAKILEPIVVRRSSHVISVSPAYPKMFIDRYPELTLDHFTVLPFAAFRRDFEVLSSLPVRQSVFNPADGRVHWVYVGRAAANMRLALAGLFSALREARATSPQLVANLRLHFIGTDYAIGDRASKSVEPIAREFGVADLVYESPHRVPYFVALRCLADADALIVPGSDDPQYTASKIYPYILAKKPLLAIFHERSSV
ncbi:MAG TPA: hypothetical protein VJU82_09425, partial [Acidobacteriaceae bacterium]|nr:hypothetical protein [Acidobacteriaceae bacterium]